MCIYCVYSVCIYIPYHHHLPHLYTPIHIYKHIECEDYESPAWFPNNHTITHNHDSTNTTTITKPTTHIHGRKSNIEQIMEYYNKEYVNASCSGRKLLTTFQDFYDWSTDMQTCHEYWDICIKQRLKIQFQTSYDAVFDTSATSTDSDSDSDSDSFYGLKSVEYLSNAKFNIADSCFPLEYLSTSTSASGATATTPPPATPIPIASHSHSRNICPSNPAMRSASACL